MVDYPEEVVGKITVTVYLQCDTLLGVSACTSAGERDGNQNETIIFQSLECDASDGCLPGTVGGDADHLSDYRARPCIED